MVLFGDKLYPMVKDGETNSEFQITKQLFLGEYQPNLTQGSRLALPKKYRDIFGKANTVVLSRGFEKCIFGYTKDDWEEESRKSTASSSSDRKSRMLKRYMFSGAYEVEFDSQGRMILPKQLMQYAGLESEDDVIIVGAGDHFEIWNQSSWNNLLSEIEQNIL